jgi:hypothetical protein
VVRVRRSIAARPAGGFLRSGGFGVRDVITTLTFPTVADDSYRPIDLKRRPNAGGGVMTRLMLFASVVLCLGAGMACAAAAPPAGRTRAATLR